MAKPSTLKPIPDYVLGFLYNRGYINKTTGEIRLQCADAKTLKYIQASLGGSITGRILRVYDSHLSTSLLLYRQTPPATITHLFIHGYFDANGCVYLRKSKYLQISISGERHFLLRLQAILVFHDIKSFVKPCKNSHTLIFSKRSSIILFRNMLSNVCGMEKHRLKLFSV